MTSVVFYFQVHQPNRLRPYTSFEIEKAESYFDDDVNRSLLVRIADRCYLPMNELLLDAIEQTDGRFRCSFSLTGSVMTQLEDWAPEALDSFVRLAETGCVEVLCETAFHSLASEGDLDEFDAQVDSHRERIEAVFGTRPTTFRNTELIFHDELARRIEGLGFDVLLGEGADRILAGRSPRRMYWPGGCRRMKLMLRDYLFSDDIAFRFSNPEWPEHPLMADTFAGWLHKAEPDDEFIGLYMDYETFGEHQSSATGIFDFMEHVPGYVLEDPRFRFETPSECARRLEPSDEVCVPTPTSWADTDRDLSAWLDNPMQRTAHAALYAMADDVRRAAELGQPELLQIWRKLTTSDHVYYMSTAHQSDGDVHEYFTPYDSPHDSFIVFMNALDDLERRVRVALGEGQRVGR